ncbi:metallophosphoesterase [Campylobacter sp. MG1]|uniref:metallophosphoesterase n=1 Tax=Campylobacter sp. MG1 TaxID=2976332 RepID=UPI00226CED67|nr:metallophosphoesterase [Campylobacter sp. MG1]
MFKIKNGAIIVADVHFDNHRKEFLYFLDYVKEKQPPQVIMLGDIFNILIGGINKSISDNYEAINKINELAMQCEVIYFEGNHDFNLENIFTNVKIIKKQPLLLEFENKRIAISHGDIFLPTITQIALNLLRFKLTIFILNLLNIIFFNKIYIKICKKQKLKKIYKKINNFEKIVKMRMQKYKKFFNNNIDYIIEGHFHQGEEFNFGDIKYKNLNAFAHDNSFFIVENNNDCFLRKVIFMKDKNGRR